MQINSINNTPTPNFEGTIIFTPEAKTTLKEMSSNRFRKAKANRILNKLLDAQEHIEHYNWGDMVVGLKKSFIPELTFATLLTAPIVSKHAVECYMKNATVSDFGIFSSKKGDIVKEGASYDINQAEEQSSLEKALEILDINERLGNEAAKKNYSMTMKAKLQKLGLE